MPKSGTLFWIMNQISRIHSYTYIHTYVYILLMYNWGFTLCIKIGLPLLSHTRKWGYGGRIINSWGWVKMVKSLWKQHFTATRNEKGRKSDDEKGWKRAFIGDLLVVGSDDLFFLHIFFVFNRVFWNMCFETTNSSVHFGLVQKGAHLCGHTEGPVARQVICRTAGDSVEATTSRHDVTGMMVTRGNYTTMASVTLSSSYLVRSLQYFHKKWGLRLLTPFIQHAIYYHFNIHIYIY